MSVILEFKITATQIKSAQVGNVELLNPQVVVTEVGGQIDTIVYQVAEQVDNVGHQVGNQVDNVGHQVGYQVAQVDTGRGSKLVLKVPIGKQVLKVPKLKFPKLKIPK